MRINEWIYKQSSTRLVVLYAVSMVGCVILGIVAFFFPIMPICYLLDIEFSNLGPIATGAWAIFIDIFVITPVFIYMAIIKGWHAFNSKQQT